MASAGLGVDGLAVGFGMATVALSPLALGTGPVWTWPRLLVVGLGLGVLATAVPYVLDQVVLRQAKFACAGVTPRHGHGDRASGATPGADAAGGARHPVRGHESHDSDTVMSSPVQRRPSHS
jgi:hypothetical protein